MPAEVQKELSDTIFTRIEWVLETASTNSDLLVAAGRRAFGGRQLGDRQSETEAGGHGSVLVADYQYGGRGRRGRSWAAPKGSALLMSVLLRPTGWEADRLALLTQAMAVSALETCRSLGAEVAIKWPNDLVGCTQPGARSKEMKLAGVLAETASPALTSGGSGGEPRGTDAAVVVGLGLNLRWSEELKRAVSEAEEDSGEGMFQPLPPVSLDQLVGKSVGRNELLVQVLSNFDRWYRRLDGETTGAEALVRKLGSCCVTLRRSVRVSTPGGVVEGRAVGLSEGGQLILETGREVTGGGVTGGAELETGGTDKREDREGKETLLTESPRTESPPKRKDETERGRLSGAELEAIGERVVISAGDCIHLR